MGGRQSVKLKITKNTVSPLLASVRTKRGGRGGRGRERNTHSLLKVSLDEAGGDASDGFAVVHDLRAADGEAGGFSRQARFQVEVDGCLEVSFAFLHLAGLLVLTRLRQPPVVLPMQAAELQVALR